MLTIYTLPHRIAEIEALIGTQHRLDEWVTVKDALEEKPTPSGHTIIVNAKGISFPLDWYNVQPPYLLPEHVWYQDEVLLALIYAKLGNIPVANNLLASNGPLQAELNFIELLREGRPVNPGLLAVETYQEFDDYRLMHNHAIVRHYSGDFDGSEEEQVHYYYNAAMDAAPTVEFLAFTAKHYINYLLDVRNLDLAQKTAQSTLDNQPSADAQTALNYLLTQIGLQRLTVPYDEVLLAELKDKMWTVLQTYERQGRALETALLLMDAAHVANISNSFSEALGYITRGIRIFEEEEQEELGYEAHLKKAILMYTWAKSGQLELFGPAAESFQYALRYFTKEDFPDIYAEIHHYLGVIYSEIPDEVKKKSIWAAVSSSSFQEALSVLTKSNYPYQYALVCNSFGNALTKYPAAIHSDNYEKALFYYNEALNIPQAEIYPIERVFTLLNYLEAPWYADNGSNEWNTERFEDMERKLDEVFALATDTAALEAAQLHRAKLDALREGFVNP